MPGDTVNGASVPANVQEAFDAATVLFSTYMPAQVAGARGPSGNALRSRFSSLYVLLDAYNNGLVGPGHCSE